MTTHVTRDLFRSLSPKAINNYLFLQVFIPKTLYNKQKFNSEVRAAINAIVSNTYCILLPILLSKYTHKNNATAMKNRISLSLFPIFFVIMVGFYVCVNIRQINIEIKNLEYLTHYFLFFMA